LSFVFNTENCLFHANGGREHKYTIVEKEQYFEINLEGSDRKSSAVSTNKDIKSVQLKNLNDIEKGVKADPRLLKAHPALFKVVVHLSDFQAAMISLPEVSSINKRADP